MKELYNYLVEASYTDAPMDPIQTRIYLDEKVKNGKNVPTEFIEYIFTLWRDNFEGNAGFIPFRGNGKSFKIARVYEICKDDIISYCKDISCPVKENQKSIYINGVKFDWGDGSLKGIRAKKGLDYEDIVVSQLQEIVTKIAAKHQEGKLNKNEYNEVCDNPDLSHWYSFYEQGGLDEILDEFAKTKDIETVLKLIKKTGSSSTKRNKNGELFDSDFNITSSDMESVLKDSGRIIADVTIETKNPQYISVKMKASQLSGVFYRKAMSSNEYFKQAVIDNDKYDDIKDSKEMIPFVNLCNVLGMDPKDLFIKYKQIHGEGLKDKEIKIDNKISKDKLGILFQKLLGGNYWYVKPGICEYVGYKNANLKVNVNSAIISPEGKTILVKCDVNGIKSNLEFRTDGSIPGPYPYRLFPKISVPDLVNKI